jgi:hypothetical protein
MLDKETVQINDCSALCDSHEFDPIICFPLITPGIGIIGAMEVCFNCKMCPDDFKLLDCFASFAAVLLEKYELEEIKKYGEIGLQRIE